MESTGANQRAVAELAGPRMPRDFGLGSLGMIMQLGGSLFMALAAMMAMVPVLSGGMQGAWVIFLFGALAAVRSAFHRAAGTALIYGSPMGPLRSVKTYIVVAFIETASLIFLMKTQSMPLGTKGMLSFLVLQLAWPVALIALMQTRHFKALAQCTEIPAPEDNGFEGVAVLMTLFGVTGTLFAGLMVITMFKLPGEVLSDPRMLLMLGVFVMLVVRSVLHTVAGVRGTKGADADGATESAARYYSFGVISAIVAGAALLVQFMMLGVGRGMMAVMMMIALLVYLLLIWPLSVRRFFTERNFSVLLAGEEAPVHRRAPDAGLTALGWLLVAMGVMGLSQTLPGALFGGEGMGVLDQIFLGNAALETFGRSPWWQVGVGGLQLWAGLELANMTDRYKLAATIYGVIATVVTIYVNYPAFEMADRVFGGGMGLGSGFGQNVMWGGIAIGLVVPIGAVILANRQLTPDAQARVRTE